jgi:hypothetical protein
VKFRNLRPSPRLIRIRRARTRRKITVVVLTLLIAAGLILIGSQINQPSHAVNIVRAEEQAPATMQMPLGEAEPTLVPVITPEPTIKPANEVEAYIVEVFGEDAPAAIAVAKCESKLNKAALNDKNSNGTTDHSVFQINSIHTKRYGSGFKTDWRENVRVAKKIYDAQGWSPWVCAKAIGEASYLE